MKERRKLAYDYDADVFGVKDDFSAMNETRIVRAFAAADQRKIRKRILRARNLALMPICHLHE